MVNVIIRIYICIYIYILRENIFIIFEKGNIILYFSIWIKTRRLVIVNNCENILTVGPVKFVDRIEI